MTEEEKIRLQNEAREDRIRQQLDLKYYYETKFAELDKKREEQAKITGTSGATDGSEKKRPVKKEKKIGRNDPCPCGSGKKYKHCCGKDE